jgi:deoxyribose-phosphate aldolase
LLKADATAKDIEQLCAEAREFGFYSVCVNGCRVDQARTLLEDSPIKVAAVVGFPLGAMDADAKRFETEAAIDAGAQEIDVVINIGRLKDGNHKYVLRELRDVVEAAEEAHRQGHSGNLPPDSRGKGELPVRWSWTPARSS